MKSNLLIDLNNKKNVDNILKMKSFNNFKSKLYPHERLNTSKRVVRNTPGEINTVLGKKGLLTIEE